MTRISIVIPDKLLKDFDERIQGLFEHRSEAIREAMRKLIKQINNDMETMKEALQ